MMKVIKKYGKYYSFPVLIGYLLIVFYASLHHHKHNFISLQNNYELHNPFAGADHDYENCERHYVVNSSIANENNAEVSSPAAFFEFIKLFKTQDNYTQNFFSNNQLRAPPLS